MDSSDSEIDNEHESENDIEHDLELPSTSRAAILKNQRCVLFYLS